MLGKATVVKKRKGSKETSKIVVQKPYVTRLHEKGARPARTTRRSLIPGLFGK